LFANYAEESGTAHKFYRIIRSLLFAMKTMTSREQQQQRRRTTIMALLAGAVLVVIGLSNIPSLAYAQATTFRDSQRSPIDLDVLVQCAAGGTGEVVRLTGEIYDFFHITLDSDGGVHGIIHHNTQGVSGTGLTTGDKYQGTSVSQIEFNGKVAEELTVAIHFRIIGQGSGNDFLLIHQTLHITVNPDGTVTAFHDEFSTECK
jgi:hypothetical protein